MPFSLQGYITDLVTDSLLKVENIKGFVVEGFPREINQARLFEEIVGRSPNMVIVFDCSTETMIQRLLIRSQMGERVDDHERIIRQRLETYHTQCEPVFAHYLQKGLLRNVGPCKASWAPISSAPADSRQGRPAYFATRQPSSDLILVWTTIQSVSSHIIGEEPPEIVFHKCCSVVDDVIKGATSTT
ncbi:hypothetical protein JD844_010224 [Phrynosoma platyrhinos]|uniref:Nucleoside-diphosphate kinase n=1 Tax=Phrynosoma platyrhinos TaxID=52577 RepID=A0ABQ7TGI6_PHRPL|nr:hypothetical protein JD844_010224 [Phrynosoma platyrhinos]